MKTFSLSLLFISLSVLATTSPVPETDSPAVFYEGQREVTSLTDIAKLKLNEGTTGVDLWSGSYWPIYQGSVANSVSWPGTALLSDDQERERGSEK